MQSGKKGRPELACSGQLANRWPSHSLKLCSLKTLTFALYLCRLAAWEASQCPFSGGDVVSLERLPSVDVQHPARGHIARKSIAPDNTDPTESDRVGSRKSVRLLLGKAVAATGRPFSGNAVHLGQARLSYPVIRPVLIGLVTACKKVRNKDCY